MRLLHSKTHFEISILFGMLCAVVVGCNPHPVQPLEGVVTGANRQSTNLPEKTKIDFLFLIDNSGSMKEEQINLRDNFVTIAEFLAELGPSADYRVAVTSTDLGKINDPSTGDSGRFLVRPDPAYAAPNCDEILSSAGITADSPILKSTQLEGVSNPEQTIVERFGCMGTIGDGGSGTERGLEAMRKALSCNHGNAKFFAQCCVPDPNDAVNRLSRPTGVAGEACASPGDCEAGLTCIEVGMGAQCTPRSTSCPNVCQGTEACVGVESAASCQTVVDGRRKIFNPVCNPEVEPDFLRPDALLVVIFLTDENDCSAPIDNRSASNKVICRYNIQLNADGIPEGYNDPILCPSRNLRECFQAECGALSPQACFEERCKVNFSRYMGDTQVFSCEYENADLTPVEDYFTFLTGLKAQPREQLVVATISGPNKFTPAGSEVYFAAPDIEMACVEAIGMDHPDAVLMTDVSYVNEECCPSGQCRGAVRASCSSTLGNAYAGRRYQRLVGALGTNGIGCPNLEADLVSESQVAACVGRQALDPCADCENGSCACVPILGSSQLACTSCVNICAEDFSGPLDAIRSKVTDVLGTYCLEKPPACLIRIDEAGNSRPCETEPELADVNNYLVQVRVDCDALALGTSPERTACLEAKPLIENGNGTRWRLILDVEGCSGGAMVKIEPVPPAGSNISIEFFVAPDSDETTSNTNEPSNMGGASASRNMPTGVDAGRGSSTMTETDETTLDAGLDATVESMADAASESAQDNMQTPDSAPSSDAETDGGM